MHDDKEKDTKKAPWGFMAMRDRERVRQSIHANGVIYWYKRVPRKAYGEYCSICGYYIPPKEIMMYWTSYKHAGMWILCEFCDSVAGGEMVSLVEKLHKMLNERNTTYEENEK